LTKIVMFSRSAVNAPKAHKPDRAFTDRKIHPKCAVRLTALRFALAALPSSTS